MLKLMARRILNCCGQRSERTFRPAAHDYTHSTAPNRRLRPGDATTAQSAPASHLSTRNWIACPQLYAAGRRRAQSGGAHGQADGRRGLHDVWAVFQRGDGCDAQGVFVRVLGPPWKALMSAKRGWRGDRLQVKLLSTDPQRASSILEQWMTLGNCCATPWQRCLSRGKALRAPRRGSRNTHGARFTHPAEIWRIWEISSIGAGAVRRRHELA